MFRPIGTLDFRNGESEKRFRSIMMQRILLCLVLLVLLAACQPVALREEVAPAVSTTVSGAYYSDTYPNLFVDLLDKSPAEVDAKIDAAWQQLFYGNDARERVYYPVGEEMAYVMDINNNDIRSEGISYGMMLAVQLDKQDEFDRLWRWAKTQMQHQSGPHRGYFAWHVREDGTMLDQNAASDGEEWIVTALFLAAARWGNGDGILNYEAEANAILQAMLHREENPDHNARVTPMFDPEEKLVVFVPTGGANTFTDPSYQTPHYYELWARWAAEDNAFWCDAAQASRAFLQRTVHPETGLAPDYANFDGTPRELNSGDGHADFRFDAWRVAKNVALDHLWFAPSDWHVEQSNRWLDFFYNEGIRTYGNQYTLAGEKLSSDHSLGLVAMNAVAALAADHPAKAEFVQHLWNASPPTGRYRYYDGLLYLLGLTQVSGHFRIYHLTPTTAAPCE